MKKPALVRRKAHADEKYLGSEPTVNALSSQCDLIRAYSWFNYFYVSDDAKNFTISYLKSINYDKHIIRKLSRVSAINLHTIGWNCRLLSTGSTLPDGVWDNIEASIKSLSANVVDVAEIEEDQPQKTVVISIQDRINAKASDLIGEIEEEIDKFITGGVIQFDVKKWSLEKGIKPQIAKRIADKFRPQYAELIEASEGSADEQLVEGYKKWRKPTIKVLALFVKKVIDHMIELDSAGQTIRKPRKKKVKPASALVAKLKFKPNEPELNLTSIDPKGIIGAPQLWVYNVKSRNLSVYNAVGNSGLSVRGTTLTGFDETTSVTKKLRKPQMTVAQVLNEGKVGLRSIMKSLSTNESKANGRINEETILLRIVK